MNQNIQNTPLVLIILDGWGDRKEKQHNGIELAQKPFFDSLKQNYPQTLIDASGPAVGLPTGIMGNSEVGHMNIGAGRIVYTGLSQIYQAIDDKSFFTNSAFLKAMNHVNQEKSTLHLMCLLSDGAVHSHQDHLYAMLQMAKQNHVQKVAIHCIMDGRDTSPEDGVKYLKQLQNKIHEIGVGYIASIAGRYYTMDRDKRWDRVQKSFIAMCGKAQSVTDPLKYIQESYTQGTTDEFLLPVSVNDANHGITSIHKNDAMIFLNFRADRARQISQVFTDTDFKDFETNAQELPAVYVCATPYDESLKNVEVAFYPNYPDETLGEILANHNITQLRLAETEKYAHVTFFFNGGKDLQFKGEDRILVKSPREVATYDLKPEMSAYKIKDELLKVLEQNKHQVIIMNFANTDMVGHTAKPEAILKAVQTVDECLSQIIPEILKQGGCALITADHGNAELMVDDNNMPMTAHTTFLVPFMLISDKLKTIHLKEGGRLCDISPTILDILKVDQPKSMTGRSLIDK